MKRYEALKKINSTKSKFKNSISDKLNIVLEIEFYIETIQNFSE